MVVFVGIGLWLSLHFCISMSLLTCKHLHKGFYSQLQNVMSNICMEVRALKNVEYFFRTIAFVLFSLVA